MRKPSSAQPAVTRETPKILAPEHLRGIRGTGAHLLTHAARLDAGPGLDGNGR
jgi:hypothetical protein